MPTATDLTRMRATLTASLPDELTVYRRTLADDEEGGQEQSYAAVEVEPGYTKRGKIDFAGNDPGATDAVVGADIRPEQLFWLTASFDEDLRQTDRVGMQEGLYEVISSAATRSRELCKRYLVKQV